MNYINFFVASWCALLVSGCALEMSDVEQGDEDESIAEKADALTTYTYSPAAAADYASSYYNNPNTNFYNFELEGGDCTNFASQSILAGFVNSTNKWTVYEGRKFYVDNSYSGNDWWYISANNRAKPEWAGAAGLLKYLKIQAANPSYTGIKASYIGVWYGSTIAQNPGLATFFTKGNVVSLSSGGEGWHSMIVTKGGTNFSEVTVAYRSAPGYPHNKMSLSQYVNKSSSTWNAEYNLFWINGFNK